MQIFLKNFDGKTIALDVDPTTYVYELKKIISMKTGIPIKIQRLIFSSKQYQTTIYYLNQQYHWYLDSYLVDLYL